MKIVQRGNRQLRIADDQLGNYLAKGYAEVDPKTGRPLTAEPVDEVKALKKENAALKKTNKDLAEQLAALTAVQG